MCSEIKFFDILAKLDALMASKDKKALNEFIELTKCSDTVMNYAFRKLDRIDWIKPLKEARIFSNASRLITDENGNVSVSHNWPQAEYLMRMAQWDDYITKQEILDIMMEIGETNDYHIHRYFTEAALAMPAILAAKWAKHEAQWLRDGNRMYGMLEDKFGLLVSKLARDNVPDVAIDLVSELLIVLPAPEGEKSSLHRREPQIRCRRYNYEQILKKSIPDLAKVAPFETLKMLCDLLEKVNEFSIHDDKKQKPNDLSYISRPAIEDHPQNHNYKINGPLITAIRDIAEIICKSAPNEINRTIEAIENHEWDVFKRIGLHLLRVSENAPLQMIEARLVNESYFNSSELHHEYYHLLKKQFGALSHEGQKQILTWIDEAKEKKILIDRYTDLTQQQRQRSLRGWWYRKLYPIHEYLTDEWNDRFLQLKDEFGKFDIPPDFLSWVGGVWTGPTSPKAAEELSVMSMDELVSYLKGWKPSGGWMGPTPDGLGSALGSLVAEQPDKYAVEIERFMDKNMDPTYVRHLISGFCQAIENNMMLPYELVFKLCRWVVDQPREIPDRIMPDGLREDFEMDVDWRQTRHEIARLFEKIFDDKLKLSYELRNKSWQIIEVLTNDPEPDLEYETKYGGKNSDPLHLSINTIRGKALHGVIHYAMWVCRHIKDDLMQKENRSPSFQDMPEVRTVIESHLDIGNCPFAMNQTDRAVFGQWLPQLIHVDTEWVKKYIGNLFPKDPDLRHLCKALWDTYLLYANLYDQVFDVIKEIYRSKIEGLVHIKIDEDTHETAENRLTEHVVILYVREKISLAEDDLLKLFFRTAQADLTAHAMDFIGRNLNSSNPPEKVIVEMFKTLWDWRVATTEEMKRMSDEELATFGWWFASGLCGDEWAFPHLEKTLERTDIKYSNEDVFEYMSRIFKSYPHQSLKCLELFIDKNSDPWFFESQRTGGVWKILEQGLANDDSTVRATTVNIIHLLGSKGYLQYRELLKKP